MTAGNVISRYYDSLLSKVIASAPTFDKAVQRMARALQEFQVRTAWPPACCPPAARLLIRAACVQHSLRALLGLASAQQSEQQRAAPHTAHARSARGSAPL